MKPQELLEAALKGSGEPNRAHLAKRLGMTEPSLHRYANGAWPDNTAARKLAEAAGLPWAEVIAALEIEKAKDEQTATAWGKALASLKRSSCAFALAVLASLAALSAHVQPCHEGGLSPLPPIIWVFVAFCRKLAELQRLTQKIRRYVSGIFGPPPVFE